MALSTKAEISASKLDLVGRIQTVFPSASMASEKRRIALSRLFQTLTSTAPARASPRRLTTANAPSRLARRIKAATQISVGIFMS